MTKVTLNKIKKQTIDWGDVWNIYITCNKLFIRVYKEFLHIKIEKVIKCSNSISLKRN